jgi:hypothetical protein
LIEIKKLLKINFQLRRHHGGGVLGAKSLARIQKLEKIKARELQQKLGS